MLPFGHSSVGTAPWHDLLKSHRPLLRAYPQTFLLRKSELSLGCYRPTIRHEVHLQWGWSIKADPGTEPDNLGMPGILRARF